MELVTFEHCYKAAEICNKLYCEDGFKCCSVNCMGIFTLEGLLLFGSIIFPILFLAFVFNSIKEVNNG